MIGASKILTVSYGTFSCTLEGFDDPFNTMKAIAEYFRDLAAEDRYFGAEPPTPDAAMLHKIAEREVQRRVEARVQDNGVILRAADADDRMPEAAIASLPMQADAVEETGPEALARDALAIGDADALPEDDAPAVVMPTLNPMPEGVAARLAKIRAAVALAEPEVAASTVVAMSDFTEDQHADEAFAPFDMVDDAEDFADEADDAAGTAFAVTDQSDMPDFDDTEDLIADLAALDGAAPADVEDAADDARDVMLANLAAMDAPAEQVVVVDIAEVDAAMDAPMDDAAMIDAVEDDAAVTDAPTAEAMEDDAVAMDDDDGGDDALMLPEIMDAPETDADDVADATWVAADDVPAEVLIGDDLDDLPEAMDVADSHADDADEMTAPEEVVVAADTAETEAAEADVAEPELAVEEPAVAEAPEDDAPAAEPAVALDAAAVLERAKRARARVIRVRRNPEIVDERPAPDAVAPQMSADEDAAATLAAEAEADLQRELAALEEDAAADPSAVEDADDDLRRQLSGMMDGMGEDDAAKEEVAPVGDAQGGIARDGGVEEDAVRRLMDQTSSEMAVPENRRRLSSIAHLKAAVAATIAERFGSKPKAAEEVEATRTEPYRNDLARTVRPARPVGANGASDRPAPLVLVSEQRIDRPAAPVAVTPVRPRRIQAQSSAALQQAFEEDLDEEDDADADNIFGDAKGFAEFADRVGANGLPELLEAAAAYGAAVEGRDSFTRPQLLRQIAGVTGDDVTREDELRSFGALLRDGRIVKLKRGQFALTETSALLAEARKIAG